MLWGECPSILLEAVPDQSVEGWAQTGVRVEEGRGLDRDERSLCLGGGGPRREGGPEGHSESFSWSEGARNNLQ